MRALKLISVSEDRAGDCLWIQLDGDAESLVPEAIKRAFPDMLGSSAVIRGFETAPKVPLSVVQILMDSATVCIAESRFDTALYTRDPVIHRKLLERFKECLPES